METTKEIKEEPDSLFLKNSDNPNLQIFKTTHRRKEFLPIIENSGVYQGDLMFFPSYGHYNHGYTILFCLIEVATRKLYVYPLKTKDVYKSLEDFISKHKVDKLVTDAGSEFISNKVKKMLEEKNITLINTLQKTHVSIVERVNRTIRSLIERYITLKGTYNFIDNIQSLVDLYNNSYHRSLGDTPNNFTDEDVTMRNLSLMQKSAALLEKIEKKFKIGNIVRIRTTKKTFEKGALPQFSLDLFVVNKVVAPYVYVVPLETPDSSSIKEKAVFYKDVLVVPKNSTNIEKPVKSRRYLTALKKVATSQKREGISEENIVEGKRLRKPNPKYN